MARNHDRDARRRPDASRHRHRNESGAEPIVFGFEPVRELIAASPQLITRLYANPGSASRFEREITAVKNAGGKVVFVDDAELSRMAGSENRHQGIVATLAEYRYADLDGVVDAKPDPLLVIDGVTDPRNLGAILRSAECAGANSVILAKDRTAGISPVAIKTSAGAWVHLKIAQCGNVVRTLEELKEKGYWIAALVPDGDTPLYDLDVSRRLALLVGAEDKGLRQLVKSTADIHVSIPMRGEVNSLNVSIATAVTLFEINRARASLKSR